MADYDKAIALLAEIKQSVAQLHQARIDPRRIVIAEGLSDIDLGLGLVKAGEFRAGNEVDPGNGFSGVRIAYPPVTYNSEEWNIVGVDNDVLQFGVRASDGTALAGGGNIVLYKDGICLIGDGSSVTNQIIWENTFGGDVLANVYGSEPFTDEYKLKLQGGNFADVGPTTATVELEAGSRGDGVDARAVTMFLRMKDAGVGERLFDLYQSVVGGPDASYLGMFQDQEIVFNDDGNDIDIRMEGSTDPNLFLLDASLDLVNIENLAVHNYTDFEEGAAPGTPGSGYVRLYAKTDGRLYSKDDGGTESGPL